MKKLILLITVLLITLTSFSQIKINYKLREKYKIEGVIFPKDYLLNFKIDSMLCRFTPSIDDIKRCESYLLLNEASVKYINMKGYYSPSGLTKKLKTYKRQYLGIVDSNKDSIVFVQLLNFKRGKSAKEYLKDGNRNTSLGSTDFMRKI